MQIKEENNNNLNNYKNLKRVIEIVSILRSENGCQWDQEQDHFSLRNNMLEEAYEAVDAINSGDITNLKEELGDVLLQVLLHCEIANQNCEFNIDDVSDELAKKLIRRHPHVFSDYKVENSDEIIKNWEKIKKLEKKSKNQKSIMDDVEKNHLTSLIKALKISKKAVSCGFEWKSENDLFDCLNSEIDEFKSAKTQLQKEEELGDILFTVVNLARMNKVDPEVALFKANQKFIQRFKKMEELSTQNLNTLTYDMYDDLWKKAKKALEKK